MVHGNGSFIYRPNESPPPSPPMFLLNYGSIEGKVYILLQLKEDGTLQAEYG